jgi:hypothetical protein
MPKKILVFLQNAWFYPSTVAKIKKRPDLYDREAIWNYAFRKSRSGTRLKDNLGEELFDQLIWDNASPELGTFSASSFPADHDHIRRVLDTHKPDIVVAMGKTADLALNELWKGKLICTPHPAARLLTNDLLMGLRMILTGNVDYLYRVRLKQEQGRYVCQDLLAPKEPVYA